MSSEVNSSGPLIFPSLLQRFIDHAPVSVVTRMMLGNQLSAARLDDIFERHAQEQYTRQLTFSSTARLLSRVVLGQATSVHASYQHDIEELGGTASALYQKLSGTEPSVCTALVRETAQSLNTFVQTWKTIQAEPVPEYRLRTLDGNHPSATQKRLQVLRRNQQPGLPGQVLAWYDHATSLISEVVLCEDGHAQERSGLKEALQCVKSADLILGDRNFCTQDFLEGLQEKQAGYLIRRHANMPYKKVGERKRRGRCFTGVVYEQDVLVGKAGHQHAARAIIIVRDKPLRDSSDNNKVKKKKPGKRTVTLLTNLGPGKATALLLAGLYLKRWKIEESFRRLTMDLRCEVNTLGYPKAALLCFCLAVLAYNTLACLEAVVNQSWTKQELKNEVSFFHMAHEIRQITSGMLIAVPDHDWLAYDQMPADQLAGILQTIVEGISTRKYFKKPSTSTRNLKKPLRKRKRHTSTYRLLNPHTTAIWSP